VADGGVDFEELVLVGRPLVLDDNGKAYHRHRGSEPSSAQVGN